MYSKDDKSTRLSDSESNKDFNSSPTTWSRLPLKHTDVTSVRGEAYYVPRSISLCSILFDIQEGNRLLVRAVSENGENHS